MVSWLMRIFATDNTYVHTHTHIHTQYTPLHTFLIFDSSYNTSRLGASAWKLLGKETERRFNCCN